MLLSTPNCTQSFGRVPVEFSHMLDVDHQQFFTVGSLRALLDGVFGSCAVEQSAPVDRDLAGLVLPRPLRPLLPLARSRRRDPAALLLPAAGPGPAS